MAVQAMSNLEELAQNMGTPFFDVRAVRQDYSKSRPDRLHLAVAYKMGDIADLVAEDLSTALRVANEAEFDSNCFTISHGLGRTFVAYDKSRIFSLDHQPQLGDPVPIFEVASRGVTYGGRSGMLRATVEIRKLVSNAGHYDLGIMLRAYAANLENYRKDMHS